MRFNLLKGFLILLLAVIVIPIFITLGWRFVVGPRPSGQPAGFIAVYVPGSGIQQMNLEEYLKGVVAAEMPAEFELEALKAQAVAARTYAVRKMRSQGGPGCDKHQGADICTDPGHGQAWVSFQDLKAKYGFFANLRVLAKIDRAVEETRGIVATYAGRPIDAIYHANSGGMTEDSEKVWGNYIPYLRSVRTQVPTAQRRVERNSFSLAELSSLLGGRMNRTDVVQGRQLLPGESIPASATPAKALEVLERSNTGRVVYLSVNGQKVRGVDFRTRLGLKSTNFTWNVEENQVVFTTLGNGHGVGMCQYGANSMARAGKTYAEILSHFYTGISLQNLQDVAN